MTTDQLFHERLQDVARIKKIFQADLVDGIKKGRSTVSKWWNGDIVPGAKNLQVIADFLGCDAYWLATGEGNAFPDDITAEQQDDQQSPQGKIDLNHEKESFSIREMVNMTMEILESKTVYRQALASNIRSFYQAVQQEDEMNRIAEEITEMRAENKTMVERMAAMAQRMERMERLLLAHETATSQKREASNG